MPAEWEAHERCWMAWPGRRYWRADFEEVCRTVVRVARAIARFEPVTMLAPPAQAEEAARACGPRVAVLAWAADDLWLRDTGPTFTIARDGRLAGVVWRFNSWGGKRRTGAADAALAARLLAHLGFEARRALVVNEGGAICVDGQGTLLTTESVLLNSNRNPRRSRVEIEAVLCRSTGARKILWLPGSRADAVTDGHVDGLAVFVQPSVVLAELAADPADPDAGELRENLRALQLATDAQGRRLKVHTVQRPPWRTTWPDDFAASYVNFYLANGAVILSRFGCRRSDEAARAILAQLFPKRRIVQLRIDAIARAGGGLHCLTQQQPDSPL